MSYVPGTVNTQAVERLAKKSNINASHFSVTSGSPIIADSEGYINNKVIQVNTFAGSLTAQISMDGINFYSGPTITGTGIYQVATPCRYIEFTATGNCSGLVLGSL